MYAESGRPHNGMSAAHLTGAVWHKATRSQGASNCVELAALPDGKVAMRNSRHPSGPALIYTRSEIAAMLAGAKAGEFDHLAA